MKETLADWYRWGYWTADMIQEAVPELISQAVCDEILGKGVEKQ